MIGSAEFLEDDATTSPWPGNWTARLEQKSPPDQILHISDDSEVIWDSNRSLVLYGGSPRIPHEAKNFSSLGTALQISLTPDEFSPDIGFVYGSESEGEDQLSLAVGSSLHSSSNFLSLNNFFSMADWIKSNSPGGATRVGQEDTTAIVPKQGVSNYNVNEKEKNGGYSREEFARCPQNVRYLHERLEMEQEECVLAKARAKFLERKVADLERKLHMETLLRKEVEASLAEAMARFANYTVGVSHFSPNTVVEEISEPQTPCSQSEQEESSSSKPGNLNLRKREKEGEREGSTTTSSATTPKIKGSEYNANYNLRGNGGVLDWTEEKGLRGLRNKMEGMELISGKTGNDGPSATWEEVAGLLVEKRDTRAMFERRLSGIWRQMGEEMGALAEVRGQEEQVMTELMAWMSHLVHRLQEANQQHGKNNASYSDPNCSQDENLKSQENGTNNFAFGRTSEPLTFAEVEGFGNGKRGDPHELSFRWSYTNGHSDEATNFAQQMRGTHEGKLEGRQDDKVLLERGQYQSSLVEGGGGEGEANQNVTNSWHNLRGRSTLGENSGGRESGSTENHNQGLSTGSLKDRDSEMGGDVKVREMEERGEMRTEIKSGWEERLKGRDSEMRGDVKVREMDERGETRAGNKSGWEERMKDRDSELGGDVKVREMEERGEMRTDIKSGWEEKDHEEWRSENDTQAFQKRTSKRPPDYQKYVEPSATDLVEQMGSYGRDFEASNHNNNHNNFQVPNLGSNRNVENANAMSASVTRGNHGNGNGNGEVFGKGGAIGNSPPRKTNISEGKSPVYPFESPSRVDQSAHLEEVKKWGEKPPVGPSRKTFVEPSATDLVDHYRHISPNGSISAVSTKPSQPQFQETDEYYRGQLNSAETNAGGVEGGKEMERERKEGKFFENEHMNTRPSEGSRGQQDQSGQGGRVMGGMQKQISGREEYSTYGGEMEGGRNANMMPSTTQTTTAPQFSGGGGGGGLAVQDQYRNSETNRRGNMESEASSTGWDSGGHISSSGGGQVRGGGGNKEGGGNNVSSRSWTVESTVYDGESEGSPSLGRQFSIGDEAGVNRQLASQFYNGPGSKQRSNSERVLQVSRSGGESSRGGRLTPLNIPLKPAYLRAPSSSSSNQGSGSVQGGGEKRGGKFVGVEAGPITLWESPREVEVREATVRDNRMSDVLRAIQSIKTEISSVMDHGDVRDLAQGSGREALEIGSEGGGGGGNAFVVPGVSRDDHEFATGIDPRAAGGGGGGGDNNFSRLRSTSYGSDGGLGKVQEISGNTWSRGEPGRKVKERERSGYFVTSPMASVHSSIGFGSLLGNNNNMKSPSDSYREYGSRKGAPPSISFHPPPLKTMNGMPPPFPPFNSPNSPYVGPPVGLKGQPRERGWLEEGMTLVTELGNSGKDFLQFGPPGGGGGREPLFHSPLVHIPSSSRSSTAAKESESASLAGDSERGQRRD